MAISPRTIAASAEPVKELIDAPLATKLEAVVLRPKLWKTSGKDMESDLEGLRFQWGSAAQDSLRSVNPSLTFFGLGVYEAVLRMNGDFPTRAEITFFDCDHSTRLAREDFNKLVATVSQSLTALTGKPGTAKEKDEKSLVRSNVMEWNTDVTTYVLTWDSVLAMPSLGTPFGPKFVRLTIKPREVVSRVMGIPVEPNARAVGKKFDATAHVVKSAKGSQIKDLPAPAEGATSYCVVEAVDRVMRYYGAPPDENELGQVSASDASFGTSPGVLSASLLRLTRKLRVNAHFFFDWDYSDFARQIDDYNRAAKRVKGKAIEVGPSSAQIDASFAGLDPAVFKLLRLKRAGEYAKFNAAVQQSVDAGVPLLWTVRLGILSDKETRVAGGDMRIIFGYDGATHEVIYTDSGHEEKRMPAEDAWVITTGLAVIQTPSN